MIRPALSSDCKRIFQLCCCSDGAQRPYPSFERAYEGRLADAGEKCMIIEEDGKLVGFVALRSETNTGDGKTTLSDLVLAPGMRGAAPHLVAEAGAFAVASGFGAAPSELFERNDLATGSTFTRHSLTPTFSAS